MSAAENDQALKRKLLILFKCADNGEPVISTLSSIFKPKLSEDTDITDCVTLLKGWLDSKKNIIIRWPKGNSSAWNLKDYFTDLKGDCDFRGATVVMWSDDKDALSNERKRLAKESSNFQESCSTPKTGSKSRKELFPTPPDSAKTSSRESFTPETPQEGAASQPSADTTPPSSSSAKRQRNGSSAVEKENKRLRLENQKMKEETQCLQQKVNELEKELNEMSKDLAAFENENMDLKEKIESMDMDPASSNLKLAEALKASIGVLKEASTTLSNDLKTNVIKLGSLVNSVPANSSPVQGRRSPSLTEVEMVPISGDICIPSTEMNKAIVAGRTEPTERCISACVAALMNGIYTVEQMSKMSLTGRRCPTKPADSVRKAKFPAHVLQAIADFMTKRWPTWHEGETIKPNLFYKIVKKAVGARLQTCGAPRNKNLLLSNGDHQADAVEKTVVMGAGGDDRPPASTSSVVERPENQSDGEPSSSGSDDEEEDF